MFFSALIFLSGIVLVQQWPQLPDTEYILLGVLPVAVIYIYVRISRVNSHSLLYRLVKTLFLFTAGMSWAVIYAHQALQHRLPESLAGKTIMVQGRVVGVPENSRRGKHFYLSVDHFELVDSREPFNDYMPRKIRLSWYYGRKHKVQAVHAGESWQFLLRLKPPHGFFNPGGFDYEGWLFQRGIDARGYIRAASATSHWRNRRLSAAPVYSVDAMREKLSRSISRWLQSSTPAAASAQLSSLPVKPAVTGMITALAIGERRLITPAQWQVLLRTGTNHLMAISGLHIGLAYLFGFVAGRWLFSRLAPVSWLYRLPAPHLGVISGLLVAIVYALLAGFSIPAQRALVMLGGFAAASLLRRYLCPLDALGLALFLVLLWDPLSVLSPGFWFSFIAVAVIFYTFSEPQPVVSSPSTDIAPVIAPRFLWFSRIKQRLMCWGGLQLMITLALFPLSLYLFQQGSLIAPLANLLMVPFVSFLVVPFVLLALLFYPFIPLFSQWFVMLAASALQWGWLWLEMLAGWPFAYINTGNIMLWQLFCAAMAMLIWFVPAGYFSRISNRLLSRNIPPQRVFAIRIIIVLVCLIPAIAALYLPTSSAFPVAGTIRLSVLDVGQGLATVVQTQHHTLVFDSGAKLGEKLDAGRSVVVPFLRASGIHTIDTLVISHGDNDHIGGAASILAAFPEASVIGQDLQTLNAKNKMPCYRGQQWYWDGVQFRFLNPPAIEDSQSVKWKKILKKRNNHSCVLQISAAGGSVLLTGDIEKEVERQLLKNFSGRLKTDVLVVAHHGSKTSSSEAFIDALRPTLAILPTGYRNRYHLPNKTVVNRYQRRHIQLLQTGLVGAVSLLLVPGQGITQVDAYRLSHHHYWNRIFDNKIRANQVR